MGAKEANLEDHANGIDTNGAANASEQTAGIKAT